MTLQEWIAIGKAKREELESHWRRVLNQPRRIGEIADQAAFALADELKKTPQVTAVVAGEDRGVNRSILMVTTSLRAGEKLPGVPEEFAGFPVVQYGVAKKREDYLKRLDFVFRAANVPEAEVNFWSKRFDDELRSIGSAYYAETPGRWITEALLAALVKGELIGRSRVELRRELWAEISDFFAIADPLETGFDEQQISRLRDILKASFAKYDIEI